MDVRATKVLVRISDIVAAMGPREPPAGSSRKEFRLGIHLLHQPGRSVDRDLIECAQGVAKAIGEYFDNATGGRMQVVP